MTYNFGPARREDAIPAIALYSPSGAGKTFTSLLLARGIVGPEGRIAMIDTERGRGSLYCDQIPGGYDTVQLTEPFSPTRYIEVITEAENLGYDIIIVDSVSHEWEGIGGVCDMAAENEIKSKKAGLHNWAKPKRDHNKFIQKILGSKVPIITCVRGKQKTKYEGTKVKKDDFISPVQSEDFIFEMTIYAEIMSNHVTKVRKWSHPDLLSCFIPDQPITIETGERIRAWSKGNKSIRTAIEILDQARAEANKGEVAFKLWFKNASDHEKIQAKTIMAELKETCKRFDNPDDDDPFADNEKQTKLAIGQFTMELSQCLNTEAVQSVWSQIPDEHKPALESTKADVLHRLEQENNDDR